jgi:glycosyltransferase involved in cell wall biosynthesis
MAGGEHVNTPIRLAVLADFPEEGWTSMDLCAEMLLEHAPGVRGGVLTATRVCPPFRRHFGPLGRARRTVFNADRLLNRLVHFPRHLREVRDRFDLFHVADHSYAALVHHLPAERTGVYCYDLDLFRCLVDEERAPRPFWFRAMARHVLRGLAAAKVVFYGTAAVRREIERHGLADPARLVHAPLGVCPEFTPEPGDPEPAAALLAPLGGAPFLLNVGSSLARKRLDVLLEVFARVSEHRPDLCLVQVGGTWTAPERQLLSERGVARRVIQLRGIERRLLASLYRQGSAVLLPTEAEGFGLPLVEALACGAPVIASDLPVLREVGMDAALFRPVGDVAAWAEAVEGLLAGRAAAPARAVRLAQAGRYSWSSHARDVLAGYGVGGPVAPRTEAARAHAGPRGDGPALGGAA